MFHSCSLTYLFRIKAIFLFCSNKISSGNSKVTVHHSVATIWPTLHKLIMTFYAFTTVSYQDVQVKRIISRVVQKRQQKKFRKSTQSKNRVRLQENTWKEVKSKNRKHEKRTYKIKQEPTKWKSPNHDIINSAPVREWWQTLTTLNVWHWQWN